MKTVELAQRIANFYRRPVLIRKIKSNPAFYTQKDNSMILKNPTQQQTLDRENVPEKRKTDAEKSLKDSMVVELRKLRRSPQVKINAPFDVVNFMRHMEDYDRERAKILHLNTKNQIVGVENISTGSLNASIVHPRESVKGAILNNSAAVIFVHNHPSGNPEPSSEDKEVHKKLKAAFGTVGIDLLDSIVIGKDGYRSLREEGM